jgi:hypothetical protein
VCETWTVPPTDAFATAMPSAPVAVALATTLLSPARLIVA